MYFYYQTAGDGVWSPASAKTRRELIDQIKPCFVSVLDIDTVLTDDSDADTQRNAKYVGPFYVDIDAELGVAIKQFNVLLDLLEKMVPLDQCRLYATGGRGFHLEVPPECFVEKPKPRAYLPAIYKEMALEMVVEGMDMRVYSARRGRMWRTPGVQRDNGKYKVPLTPAMVRALNVDLYDKLCAEPQPEPLRPAPTLSFSLHEMYLRCEAKVDAAMKARKSGGKANEALIQRYKGRMPPTVQKLMNGEVLAAKGFNDVILQIGISAANLGLKPEDVLQACEGLIAKHQSDGHRYNTPSKRRAALAQMLYYTQDNPCYEFSVGGLRSLLPEGTHASDLEGIDPDEEFDEDAFADNEDGWVEDEEEAEAKGKYGPLDCGLRATREGYKVVTGDGARLISDGCVVKARQVSSLETPQLINGWETEWIVVGKPKRIKLEISATQITNLNQLAPHLARAGIRWQGSNTAIQGLHSHMVRLSSKTPNVFRTHLEGLDLLRNPNDPSQLDVVWVTPKECRILKGVEGQGVEYAWSGGVSSTPQFDSDLLDAPVLDEDDEEVTEYLEKLLSLNSTAVMGNLVGWFSACFLRRWFQITTQQFPILLAYGTAGAGKTTTTKLMERLFYYRNDAKKRSCVGDSAFAIRAAVAGGTSIPVLLDEYKPRNLPAVKKMQIDGMLHVAFNGASIRQGGAGDGNSGWKEVSDTALAAPICVLAESLITETALVERMITVPFTKESQRGGDRAIFELQRSNHVLGKLGAALLRAAVGVEVKQLSEDYLNALEDIRKEPAASRCPPRVVQNAATVLYGLRFVRSVLQVRLPTKFERLAAQFSQMEDAVKNVKNQAGADSMSETAKVLDAIAFISRDANAHIAESVQEGVHFVYVNGNCIDLEVRSAFSRYRQHANRLKEPLLFETYAAFASALRHYRGVVEENPLSSPLSGDRSTLVCRLSLETLYEDGVSRFGTGPA